MTHLSPRALEAGAKAIARLIPTDAGSTWNPGFGEDFPREYSKAEQKQIRTIAQLAITAALEAEGMVVVPSTPTLAMIDAGSECNPTQWNDNTDPGFAADVANDVYRAMVKAATLPQPPRHKEG